MSETVNSSRFTAINNFRITAKKWEKNGLILGVVNITLGIVAIVLSVTVAYKPPMFGTNPDIFTNLAYCSAAATGILTFLSAKESAGRYTAAFRNLQEMIDRYDADESYTFDHVAEAARTGAAIIDASQRAVRLSPA